ncbi:PE family protein [Mycobacterium szulgai]|uniref:PE family protein n=1 Tax=Mycobacterium szulgai TaxID=1787 RepID=UPI0021F35F0B|nr:PE family protein [Mycobacterium szulgai]MCV7075512.1 PE family protein [Mycobacterium szulgai]
MSFMFATPEALAAAASDIAGIGSGITAANAAASVPTTGVLASAADSVSTQVAALLSAHGQGYQQISAKLATFHDQFVAALNAGANSYASAEAGAGERPWPARQSRRPPCCSASRWPP